MQKHIKSAVIVASFLISFSNLRNTTNINNLRFTYKSI